jgi:fumarate hydratase class II
LNRHVDLTGKMLRHIEQRTGIAFYEAKNHFEAQGGKDAVVEASGQLKTIAVSLFKIANDVRLLGSGPRCGIGEIQLPATQPGSSICPANESGDVRIDDDGLRSSLRQRRPVPGPARMEILSST